MEGEIICLCVKKGNVEIEEATIILFLCAPPLSRSERALIKAPAFVAPSVSLSAHAASLI